MATLRFLNRTPAMEIRLVYEGGRLSVVKRAEPGTIQSRVLAREARALSELSDVKGLPRLAESGEGYLKRQFLVGLQRFDAVGGRLEGGTHPGRGGGSAC
ncbi:hypothetical protein IV102_25525 [bacterium]|nr:hypothetical protein [bacterium]